MYNSTDDFQFSNVAIVYQKLHRNGCKLFGKAAPNLFFWLVIVTKKDPGGAFYLQLFLLFGCIYSNISHEKIKTNIFMQSILRTYTTINTPLMALLFECPDFLGYCWPFLK